MGGRVAREECRGGSGGCRLSTGEVDDDDGEGVMVEYGMDSTMKSGAEDQGRTHASEVEAQLVQPKAQDSSKLKTFSIYQWNLDNPTKPQLQNFQIDLKECGPMVLDALIKIKNKMNNYRKECIKIYKIIKKTIVNEALFKLGRMDVLVAGSARGNTNEEFGGKEDRS
ncbi:hypothetical protein NE237_014394 [Protea cynaroides]|uniref:Uncharacterized protein n=1 Tax=Protea cynaroides TaxID=273540 RepID=A0A9Q0QQ37_9MAGN|nr:hypothetical protein NE237_014394 [Protea cynaroides]